MKFMSVLNNFLENFYASFAPPTSGESAVSAKTFYESVILEALRSLEFRKRASRQLRRSSGRSRNPITRGHEGPFRGKHGRHGSHRYSSLCG